MGRFSFQQRSTNQDNISETKSSADKETIEPMKQTSSLLKFKKKLVPSRFYRKKPDLTTQNNPTDDDATMSVENDCDFSIATHKITNISGTYEDEIEMTICSDEEDLSRDGSASTDNEDPKREHHKKPSIIRNTYTAKRDRSKFSHGIKRNKYCVLREAPSAEESAYRGPPRFDWIDVETAAAIRVQAAFRRFKANKELERQGLMTAGMRKRNKDKDNSSYWSFFLDPFSLSSNDKSHSSQGDTYLKKKREREEREAELRKFHMKHKSSDVLVEEIEVVEDFIDC